MFQVGTVVNEVDGWLHLTRAGWVVKTGAFSKAIESCDFDIVDWVPNEMFVAKTSIVDVTILEKHPKDKKS